MSFDPGRKTPLADDTQTVFQRAYAAAVRLGRDEIRTGALLIGIAEEPDPRAPAVALLRGLGCDPGALRSSLERAMRTSGAGLPPASLALGASAEAALAAATREAIRLRRPTLEPVHLLLGLLGSENDASRALERHGVTYAAARGAVDSGIREGVGQVGVVTRPTPAPPPPRRGGLFISYRRIDASQAADVIYDVLTGAFGTDAVFKDVDSIPLGGDFQSHLAAAVRGCRVLLAVISPAWGARIHKPRDYVRRELELALEHGVRVVPILLDGAQFPSAAVLPPSLRGVPSLQGLELRRERGYRPELRRLVEALRRGV